MRPEPPTQHPERAPRALLTLAVAWLHLAVLWSFACAQPLFGVLADSPDFFVARGNTSGDIVLLALVLVLGPPTFLVALEALLRPVPRVRQAVHLVFVAGLAALLALKALVDTIDGGAPVMLALAAALGVALAWAYRRFAPLRSVLTVLGPAPAVFLALFLLFSPVTKLVFPDDVSVSGAPAARAGAPVVVVIFDEFFSGSLMGRDRRVDASRFPGLAALARGSTWYRNATTISGSTARAVPAIMTGRAPRKGQLPIAADHPESLFTLLGERYDMDVSEEVTAVCPTSLCSESEGAQPAAERRRALVKDLAVVTGRIVLPRDLREDLPAVDRTFGNFGDGGQDASPASGATGAVLPEKATGDRAGRFERFIARVGRDGARPSLRFLHVTLPHVPWQYLPSGQRYPIGGPEIPGLADEAWADDQAVVDQAHQRYLLQAGFADRLIGKLLARLRSTGRYDDTLLVVAADHGVSFRAGGGRRGPGPETLADIAGMPLFVKAPEQLAGRVVDADVRTIDILPTIAHHLGIELPWRVDGRSAEPSPAPGTRSRPVIDGLTFTPERFARARDAAVERAIRRFGAADRFAGLFRGGPNGSLVGRKAGDLAGGSEPGARVELDGSMLLSAVTPNAQVVPAYVSGQVAGVPAGAPVAVALNGMVRATSATFDDRGTARLGVMIPASALRRGANRVDVYAIRASGGARRLALIPQVQETFVLGEDDGQPVLTSSGRRFAVREEAARGYVEVVDEEQRSIRGWATRPDGSAAAERLVAFAGTRFLGSARPAITRSDLARSLGPGAGASGFELTAAGDFDAETVRVFAIVGDGAKELLRAP